MADARPFSGKRLLVLGAYRTEGQIVRCAQSLGAKAVVTDNHADWGMAPAKYVADEAWDVSWSDISALAQRARESGVDGVIAGFSERRVACAAALARELGLPFYADGSDLRTIQDKARFKQACEASGVDVAASYATASDVRYPVIVKPADNGGSRGISICHREGELAPALLRASEASDSGSVLMEEYIVADEVMVYYVVRDGEASLSAMCDRYMHSFDPSITQLPVGYRFPSRHLPAFLESHDRKFRRLISRLGVRDGLIAFQCLVDRGRFIPFDPTYRLDGTMAYEATQDASGANALKLLIAHSLTGSMELGGLFEMESPEMGGIRFELPILLGKGRIAEVEGMGEAERVDGVYFVHQCLGLGDSLTAKADFSQIFCRIQLRARDEDELEGRLSEVLGLVSVRDEGGDDMVLYRDAAALAHGRVER